MMQISKTATLHKGAKIGAKATILPDIEIGEDSLIGSGSVVVSNVPPRKVVVGNPSKVIKDISKLKCPYNLIEKTIYLKYKRFLMKVTF